METERINEKQKLEEEKLKLDIIELKKPWYTKSNYLQVLLPTTVAIGSLLYAITSGVFSTKYDQLQLQKEQLKLETLYFQEKKDSIMAQTDILLKKNVALSGLIQELNSRNIKTRKDLINNALSLSQSRNQINTVLQESVETKSQLESDIALLNKEKQYLTGENQKLVQNIKTTRKDIYDFSYGQKVLTDSIKYLNEDIKDLKKQLSIFLAQKGKYKPDYLDQQDYYKRISKSVDKSNRDMLKTKNKIRRQIDTMTVDQMKQSILDHLKRSKVQEDRELSPAIRNN